MTWIEETKSSNITGFGYNEKEKILCVAFNNTTLYRYYDVPKKVFEDMKAAESKGKFMHTNLRGKYEYRRVVENG